MNHITFKDKEGFDINVLAFDGESNFAILDRTSTGSPTPYVVVKGLDTESATWSNSEGYFSNYGDCVRKYKSSVLEHTKSDIPMKAMFEYILRRDIEPMLSRTLTDDEVWQAYDSFMQNDDFASLLDREIVPMALDIIEENERRENLKIQDIIDAPLKWDSKTKPEGAFIGMTVADFVFSHGLHQNMKLNDFNELLAKEGYSTFPNKQYPFTNLERMISDEEFKLDVLNISNNLNKIYDETDFVYEKGIEESDVAEVVFDGICDDYELSRLVNKCEGKDQLKDFVEHCEDIQGLFVNAVDNYVNDQINGIVQDPFYKVETMGDYQIPMRVLDAYNDLYVATLATTEYIYYLHDSDDVLMVGLENRQTIARGEFAMDSYQESFENIYYGNSYEEEIWMDEYEKDAKTQELESNEMEL